MRSLISRVVPDLIRPDGALLDEARQAPPKQAEHARFLQRIEAFHAIEGRSPAKSPIWPGSIRVVAFNAERLKDRAAVRSLMDRAGAYVALISEVDVGMARSGNAHTIRELIGSSAEGYLYGVEFVELDLGDEREMRQHAGERNLCGFHGNAIVSALAWEEAHLIPLEENGLWFPGRNGAQRRIGGRMALAARISKAPCPFWVVSVHLESKTDPADRQAQIRNLLRALDTMTRNEPCIIGGDFNTKALPRAEDERHLLLHCPERYEPLFDDLRSAGFAWVESNLAAPTQRTGPASKPQPPFGKLDWIVIRGMTAQNPKIIPALDRQGKPVSDHEMLSVDLNL